MLRSHPSSVFVLKYYAPFLFFGATFIFWSSRFRFGALVILIPLLFGVFFSASLAVLRIPDGTVHYRRLFSWRKLHYDEISGCGVSWVPGTGYLRLRRFLWPWGKLYFILDRNKQLFRPERPLLRYIQERIDANMAL